MTPPVRLRDDPSTLPAMRTELTRATSRDNVAGYDATAGLARFEAAVGGGGGPAGSPPGAAPAATKGVLGAALKGALAGVATLGVASAISLLGPAAPPVNPPAMTSSVMVTAAPAPSAAPELAPQRAPGADAVVATRPATAPRRAATTADPPIAPEPPAPPPAPPEPPAAPLAAPGPGSAPPPVSSADALALELENLSRLRALEASDPAGALTVATEGQRRFPAGIFAQEREAIAIGALVRLGRAAEARARGEAFLAAYPRSAFAERIRKQVR